METHLNPHNSSAGNGVAFLFGVMFNLMTNLHDPRTSSYLLHAIAGGIICLFFKMLGDLFTPLLKEAGEKLKRWIKENYLR